jgi:hypothetical protein
MVQAGASRNPGEPPAIPVDGGENPLVDEGKHPGSDMRLFAMGSLNDRAAADDCHEHRVQQQDVHGRWRLTLIRVVFGLCAERSENRMRFPREVGINSTSGGTR